VIVNHVSRAMGERRLSIRAVAQRSGLAYSTVHAIYHDRAQRLDWQTVDGLCRGIGVRSLLDLFEYVSEEEASDAPSRTSSDA
jgi:putative transcriptional regulator